MLEGSRLWGMGQGVFAKHEILIRRLADAPLFVEACSLVEDFSSSEPQDLHVTYVAQIRVFEGLLLVGGS